MKAKKKRLSKAFDSIYSYLLSPTLTILVLVVNKIDTHVKISFNGREI